MSIHKNEMLSTKRNRSKQISMCIKCKKNDNDILTFTSIFEVVEFVKKNIKCDISEYVLGEGVRNDKQKGINVKICKKCLYNVLFNKGIKYFYSEEVSGKKTKWNGQIENVYKTCFSNLKECVDIVKAALTTDLERHETLMTKVFLRYFFGKNQQLFSKYNADMDICKNQMRNTVDNMKDIIENNDNIGTDKKIKVFSEKKLKQIFMSIRSVGNVFKDKDIENRKEVKEIFHNESIVYENSSGKAEDKDKKIDKMNESKFRDNKLATMLIPPPLLSSDLFFMHNPLPRKIPDVQTKSFKFIPPPPLPQGLLNNPFFNIGIPNNLDLCNLRMKNRLSLSDTLLNHPPKLFNPNQFQPLSKFNPLPFPSLQKKP